MRTIDREPYVGPSDTTVMLGESAKTGFRFASIGTLVGAAVGVALAAFLKLPKGRTVKIVEGLETGTKTAGAIMGGAIGMATGELIGSTYGMMKGAQAAAQSRQHLKDLQSEVSSQSAVPAATEQSPGRFMEKISAEREEKALSEKSSGRAV